MVRSNRDHARFGDYYQLLSIALSCPDQLVAQGVINASIIEDIFSTMDSIRPGFTELSEVEEVTCGLSEKVESPQEALSCLRREYTRLFTDPSKPSVSIYETTFIAKGIPNTDFGMVLFRSPEGQDALSRYKSAGAQLAINEPPDHMRIECEFMGYIHRKLEMATDEKDTSLWAVHLEDFERVHISRWFRDFFIQMYEASEHPFYRLVSLMGIHRPCYQPTSKGR